MSENSSIEWTDHTFNPWIGCAKVSPGCANCYAATQDKFRRWTPDGWGKGKPRKRTSPANWKQPLAWNRDGGKSGTRPRVFCASLADWLDDEVPIGWLIDLFDLISATPHLDWLLLTKRPQNFRPRFEKLRESRTSAGWWMDGREGCIPANVWIGTTVEDQARADERLPLLLQIPARVRFLSCEPLLGPVDLFAACFNDPDDSLEEKTRFGTNHRGLRFGVDWVIAGGESGPGARPMHPAWAQSLRDQCNAAGVPFLFKQWGEWHPDCLCPGKGHPDRTIPRPRPGLPGVMFRCGKSAGRLLDGQLHHAFPTP